MKDLINNVTVVPALTAALIQTTTNGLTVNTTEYESVLFAVEVDIAGDTLAASTKFFEFSIQESADGSTNWAQTAAQNVQYAPTGAASTGSFAILNASNAAAVVLVGGYLGTTRYVRMVITVTGTMTNGTTMGAVAVLGNARHKPGLPAAQLP